MGYPRDGHFYLVDIDSYPFVHICVLNFIAYQLLLVVIDRGLRTLFICYLLKNSMAVKKGAKWPV